MAVALDNHFSLNSFEIYKEYSDFSVKISNFLWRSGGLAPEPSYTPSKELLAYLGGRPPNFGEI